MRLKIYLIHDYLVFSRDFRIMLSIASRVGSGAMYAMGKLWVLAVMSPM